VSTCIDERSQDGVRRDAVDAEALLSLGQQARDDLAAGRVRFGPVLPSAVDAGLTAALSTTASSSALAPVCGRAQGRTLRNCGLDRRRQRWQHSTSRLHANRVFP